MPFLGNGHQLSVAKDGFINTYTWVIHRTRHCFLRKLSLIGGEQVNKKNPTTTVKARCL